MPNVKLNLAKLTIPQKIELAQAIVTDMTGNDSFPTPTPTLAAVTAATNALSEKSQAARTARLAAVTATSEQDNASVALDTVLGQLASYVDMVANGNADTIRSAGMDVRAEPTKPVALDAPVIKTATVPAERGAVKLTWMPLYSAKVYVIEHTPDMSGQAGWTNGADFTGSRGVVSGLTPGQRYLFRVAGVNSVGKGPWSQTVEQLAAL
jgi:Fibronectin type III domain